MAEVYELFEPLARRRSHEGHQLSGGERQMLALGRALVGAAPAAAARRAVAGPGAAGHRPDHGSARASCATQTGLTVLLVEQNVRSALSVADQGVVMSLGEIVVTADGRRAARRREPAPRVPRLLTDRRYPHRIRHRRPSVKGGTPGWTASCS